MKNYWLFAYRCYYPNGGMGDIIEKFETLEEALFWFEENKKLLQDEDGEVIWNFENKLTGMDVAYIYCLEDETKVELILR